MYLTYLKCIAFSCWFYQIHRNVPHTVYRSVILFAFFFKFYFIWNSRNRERGENHAELFLCQIQTLVVAVLSHQDAPVITSFRSDNWIYSELIFLCFLAQETSPNILPVSSVEQRLLELNRQSAAARGRLLELIEQQKQNVSAKVSPSGSPIPPSAFSPQSAGLMAQSGITLIIWNCM